MDLKVGDVAQLLNVSEEAIAKLIEAGKIPVYKINDQFLFSREEIESWMLNSEFDESSPFGEKQIYPNEEEARGGWQQFSLYRALNNGDVIIDLDAQDKESCIRKTMSHIAPSRGLDAEVISEMLLDRENLMPTALNQGLAVPHTRDFLLRGGMDLIVITYPEQPLDWGALDGQLVHSAFFLFAADDKHHLNLLAKLAHLSTSSEAIEMLKSKCDKKELLSYVKNWESNLNKAALVS